MQNKQFHGNPESLRSPERISLLEIDRTVSLSLEQIVVKNLLDIGTGTGVFAEAFSSQGIDVVGIDVNPEILAIAQRQLPNIRFCRAEAEKLPYADNSFDLVFFGHVLHETSNPVNALLEAHRVSAKRVIILEWPYRHEIIGPPLEERLETKAIEDFIRLSGFHTWKKILLRHMVLYRLEI